MDLTPVSALELIHELAEDSKNIVITPHAKGRMKSRIVSITQVIRCLKNGVFVEEPYRDMKGGWSMKLEVWTAGRPISVVLAIHGRKLIIITVIGD